MADDPLWQIAVTALQTRTDRYRCITAAQGSAAPVRFGSEGRSEAIYQVRIPEHSAQ
jgi:hypothetical protein